MFDQKLNQNTSAPRAKGGTAFRIVFALVLHGLATAAVAAPPVAILTEVEGFARIITDRQAMTPRIALAVDENSLFLLEKSARIVLAYPDTGVIFEMQGPGRFKARSDGVQRVELGRLTKRDLIPELRALRIRPDRPTLQASVSMRGGSAEGLEAFGPRGSRFGRDPIRICWEPRGHEWRYRVRVVGDDGVIVFEVWTAESAIELPNTVLTAAKTPYLWYVHAEAHNKRFAEAAGLFERLGAASERALLQAEWAVPQSDTTGRVLIQVARRQLEIEPDRSPICWHGADSQASEAPITAAPE